MVTRQHKPSGSTATAAPVTLGPLRGPASPTPPLLFGRENVATALHKALQHTSRGHGAVVLLPGESGSGKTSLALTLEPAVRRKNGFFLHGKFNQYDRHVPYVAWRYALADVCRAIAAEDSATQDRWKSAILDAVGGQGQVLVDLVPAFARILGAQPPVPDVSPVEARHRFAAVICALLGVVCRPEHPVVLFIDDWQWSDEASAELLTQLGIGSALRYLLVVTAFRREEVDDLHPLAVARADLERQGVTCTELTIESLGVEHIEALIAETLPEQVEGRRALAEAVHARTGGNPYFAKAVLGRIAEVGIGALDTLAALPDDVPPVVAVLSERLAKLDAESRFLLSHAACVGHRFDLETVATVTGVAPEDCRRVLDRLPGDLVVRVGTSVEHGSARYRFYHDRVQQAANVLTPAVELPGVRLAIARRMVQNLSQERQSDLACEIAEHFNAAIELVTAPEERVVAATVNVTAARRARAGAAYRAAVEYHRAARRHLEVPALAERLWDDHATLALDLFREQAETEFVVGDTAEAERCIRVAVSGASDPVVKADILAMLVVQHTLRAQYAAAVATGRQALSMLGLSLPDDEFERVRDEEIAAVQRALTALPADDHGRLPSAVDARMKGAARVLIAMGPPTYRSHPRLWSVIVPRVVGLILQHGWMPQAGYAFPALAGLLAWVRNDFTTGRTLTALVERQMADPAIPPADRAVYHLMIGSSVRHWFSHLRTGSDEYGTAYRVGLAGGNLQYAAYAFGHDMYCRFYQGAELGEVLREAEQSLAFGRSRHNQWAIDLLEGGVQVFEQLRGRPPRASVDGHERDYAADIQQSPNTQVQCVQQVLRASQCLVMGDAQAALASLDAARPLLDMVGTQGLWPWVEYTFCRALVLAQVARGGNADPILHELACLESQLRIWAAQCPENFEHKHRLVSAERARLEGRDDEAAELFDRAIDEAAAAGFVQWEGLANERAAAYWRTRGDGWLDHAYWNEAFYCYDRWGAKAKLDQMLEAYGAHEPRRSSRHRAATRSLALLRRRADEIATGRGFLFASRKAEELATAADNLRARVEERRLGAVELARQRDDLEQRVAERTAELQILNRRLQTATSAARIGVWDWHIATDTLEIDAIGEKLLGLEATGGRILTADSWRTWLHPDDLGAFESALRSIVSTEAELSTTVRLLRADGDARHMRVAATAVRDGSGAAAARVVGVFWDVTDEMVANLELRRSNTELEQFAYVASHDLQEPLRMVSSYVQLLQRRYQGQLDEKADKYIRYVVDGAHRMQRLIDDVLAYSRVESRAATMAPADATPVVQAVIESLRTQRIPLDLTVDVGPLPTVLADESQLFQLFQNLLGNAIKFRRADVPLQLAVRAVALDASRQWRFEVEDNGIGIEMRHATRVFQMFQRLHTRDAHEGNGIGLTIAKKIVERHGGSIWFESEPGRGTTFFFTLRAAPVQSLPASAA